MLNNKQRSRWLSIIISDLQRYISKANGQPETPTIQRALNIVEDARRNLDNKIKSDETLDKPSENL
jgi:hypothetical protein